VRRSDILWLISLLLVLLWWQANYLGRPGQPALAPERWPGEQAPEVELAPGAGGTVLVFVHPHCPCSQATLAQLRSALEQSNSPSLACYLIVLQPELAEPDFYRTSLWRSALDCPGVKVVVDQGGRLSRQFGIATSGQTLFYDFSGRLQFAGGLTATRGHQGPSQGLDDLLKVLRGGVAPSPVAVFGCPLWEELCRP
jgi:hypothetical protein